MTHGQQLLFDLLAWVGAGHPPHEVPGAHTPSHITRAVDRLLATTPTGGAPLLTWSPATWRYQVTAAGQARLAAWQTAPASHPAAAATAKPNPLRTTGRTRT